MIYRFANLSTLAGRIVWGRLAICTMFNKGVVCHDNEL